MAQTNRAAAPRVYSYIRFSTSEQALGDSERRQLDDAKAWATRQGSVLDESLRLTDRGLSGYRGTHRKSGALGRFLELVEAGEIPSGSVLLVENIDRLSREGVATTLRQIIFKLWDHGITLQSLHPEESYPPGSDQNPKFLALFLYMQRARDESEQKSHRIRQARESARKQAREQGRILTRRCPNWLTVTVNRKFEVIPAAAAAVKMIFELKLAGFGSRTIAIKLNATAPWKPKNGWRESYIKKTLKNRAAIGEYQPFLVSAGKRTPCGEPIENYYPAIVTPEIFHSVQEHFKQNQGRGGRRDKVANLFSHLAKCAYCGGPMHFINKGDPPKGQKYLRCENGYRGNGCARYVIRYDECENAILQNCEKLRPDQVLPNPDRQNSLCRTLRLRIQGKDAELRNLDEQIENFVDQIGTTKSDSMRNKYESRITDLERRKRELAASLQDDVRSLAEAERGQESFSKWTSNLRALQHALATGDVDVRRRLQSHVREFISKIEVFAVGWQKESDPESPGMTHPRTRRSNRIGEEFATEIDERIGDIAPQLARTTTFRSFLRYVTKRRMSKEGRFLRVHFKTGARIDIVPVGSLASGMELLKTGRGKKAEFQFVSPDIDRLWREFRGEPADRAKLATTC